MAEKRQGRRTAEQAKLTKIQIMTHATMLFCEHGYQQVSLRDISVKAGVSHSLIRHYFGAKHQIWEEIVHAAHDYMERYMIALREEVDVADNPKLSLYLFLSAMMAFVVAKPRLMQLMFACVQLTDPIKQPSEEEQRRNNEHLDLMIHAFESYQNDYLDMNEKEVLALKWKFISFASTPVLLEPMMLRTLSGDKTEALLIHWRFYEKQIANDLDIAKEQRRNPTQLQDVVYEFPILDTDVEQYLRSHFDEQEASGSCIVSGM